MVTKMKDLHWFIVFGLLLATPFLPSILKAKCPKCGKRKVQSLDTFKVPDDGEPSGYTFVALYRCDSCAELFKKIKEGQMLESSEEEHQSYADEALS